MDSRINHSEPTNVVLTLKDETVALTAIATNPELSEANPIKLSDISVGLDEVTPHPGLEPVVLVEGEGGVSAVLHPTSTYPSPGVRVYVLQLTNISKLQVCGTTLSMRWGMGGRLHGFKNQKVNLEIEINSNLKNIFGTWRFVHIFFSLLH